jgi:tetratricopeptide (TPR) repeat protein
MLWTELDISGALQLHGKALAINQTLAGELPNDSQIKLDLAKSYQDFGYMHGASGHADEAIDNIRKGVALLEELAGADPASVHLQDELALSYDNLALMLTDLKKNHSEALTIFRKSQKIGDALLAADPTNTKLQRGQAIGDFNVALVSASLGDTRTALESSRRALATLKKMAAADPQNEDFRQGVANAQQLVCEVMIKTGEAAEAIRLLSETEAGLEKSFAASPSDEILHFRIASIQGDIGHGHVALASDAKTPPAQRLVHWREARQWFQKSHDILQVFRDAGKLTGADSERLDAVDEGIGKCDAALGRPTS